LGIGLLLCVTVVMLFSPSIFFSPTVTFIDTELYKTSGNEAPVKTRTDFGSREVMGGFPRQIGKWTGSDYDVTEYVKLLGANDILLRLYQPSTFTQPVFFTIVQSKTDASFHPPKVCFNAQGYQVQEEGDEKVDITDAAWLQSPSNVSIPLKRIVVTKAKKDGPLTERRVSLFCYVKGNQFYSDTVTMIQTEALAPLEGGYEGSLQEQLDFVVQAMPLMFAPGQAGQTYQPVALMMAGWGPAGYVLIGFLFGLPIGIILFPRIRRKL
jgi:hypothetical protein